MNEIFQAIAGLIVIFVLGGIVVMLQHSSFDDGRRVGVEEGIQFAAENDEELDLCMSEQDDLKSALQEANDNIETANESIDSAKIYSGETYGEMRDALDGLETVDTVDEP